MTHGSSSFSSAAPNRLNWIEVGYTALMAYQFDHTCYTALNRAQYMITSRILPFTGTAALLFKSYKLDFFTLLSSARSLLCCQIPGRVRGSSCSTSLILLNRFLLCMVATPINHCSLFSSAVKRKSAHSSVTPTPVLISRHFRDGLNTVSRLQHGFEIK